MQADLRDHIGTNFGPKARDRYWELFEQLRDELGYTDYLGALERYRVEELHDPRVLRIANWLAHYPFADRLYTGALEAVRHARRWGATVILSDGDAVFQPRKVDRSGLWRAFDDRVLIYIHKEQELDDVAHWFPVRHYVLVDDSCGSWMRSSRSGAIASPRCFRARVLRPRPAGGGRPSAGRPDHRADRRSAPAPWRR